MVLTPQQFDSLADAFQAFYDALPTADVSAVNAFLSRLVLPGYQLSSAEILNCRMELEFYISRYPLSADPQRALLPLFSLVPRF